MYIIAKMKIRLIVLLFLIVAFTDGRIFSQTLIPAPDLTANNIYGPNPLLYNGLSYSFSPPPGTKGSQFLYGPKFVKGSIQLRGEKFTNLLLNYDVYNQQIVLEYKTKKNDLLGVILPNSWIKTINLWGKHFESLSFQGNKPRIYQVIGKGYFQILYTWRKFLNPDEDPKAVNLVFSKPSRVSYLKSGNKLMHYRDNRSFIALFNPKYKSLLKKYLRKNRIKLNQVKKSGMPAVLKLINYCNSLYHQGKTIRNFHSISTFTPNIEIQKVMNCHFNNVSFEKFCQEVYQRTGIRVLYKQQQVKNIKVSLNTDSITARQAVTLAVRNTGFEVSCWNHYLLLMPHKKLLNGLPSFKPESQSVSANKNIPEMTASEERYLTGRRPGVTKTIQIGHKGGRLADGKATILGRIIDKETGGPILFATCYVKETKTGAVSGKNGFFTLVLKPGKYTCILHYVGYQRKEFLINVQSSGKFTVKLLKAVYQIHELVVHGDKEMSMTEKDPGINKVSMSSIKGLPMMMGERNILKVSGTLPGIVSEGEGTSGLSVRGGGADQNAFYIDKVPIYNTTHLFGFFPAFNANIIKDFSVYKGYVPVMYGGRLSSVFNVITKQGDMKRFTAHGGVSPVAANVEFEGPIKKDKLSYIFSGRSTYSDWILKKINDPTISSSAANFYDYSGELSYNATNTQMQLFYYHSYDHFKLAKIDDYIYSNNGASVDINHNFSNSFRGDFTFIGSQYKFHTVNEEQPVSAYQQAYEMEHYEIRANFNKTLSNNNLLTFGGGILLHKLNRGNVIPYGKSSLLSTVALGKEKGISASLYASDTYRPFPLLSITAGMRFTMYSPLGPSTVFNYQSGMPVDPLYVSDTLHFGNNTPIHWYPEPDIRAAIKYQTDENGSIKLAFNQMHQNLFMLNNTLAISPNVQWKMADYHIRPSKSNQVSLGVFRTIPRAGIGASLEVYYKEENNYPQFKDGASFLDSPHVETEILPGTEKSYGVEMLLKRTNHKLNGWISYTYSRSLMRVNGGQTWNSINNGKTYPSDYDIPNDLNMVIDYHLNMRVALSAIMTYRTGRTITYPIAGYYLEGVPYLQYSSRNAYRIPNYFRMDASMSIEGNLKRHKPLHSSFVISIYNLTGRDNPYTVYFNTSDGKLKGYYYSLLGVPIFTVTWNFKLGNYASE